MSMYATILVAVDGGELTNTITEYALRFPREIHIHFVFAVDPGEFLSRNAAAIWGTDNERSAALQAARKIVDSCVATARTAGLIATGHVVEAPPVDAIIDTANELSADVIVMASHHRSGFARFVFGSVAEGVARRARTAVLLVPSGLDADDPSRHLHQIFQGV